MPHHNDDPILRKLDSVFGLNEDERAAVAAMPRQVVDIKKDQDIVREGDRPSRCFAILEGFACTFKITGRGSRQITAFHIPGDIPDLQSLHLKKLDVSISTMTPCKVAFIQHDVMRGLCRRYPRITSALWRETLIDASIAREWVTNLGQRPAASRVAHLACEFLIRMQAVGLASEDTCQIPIRQAQLADATGMSAVHVNRSLQELRARKLISLKGEELKILDWTELTDVGDFDPAYLHLDRR